MDHRIARNRQFLADLFAGPFRGHGIIAAPPAIAAPYPGDVAVSSAPLTAWLDYALRRYEAELELLEALDHDGVPSAHISTGTELFAAAFGCPVHVYPDSPPAALPLVTTAKEAEALPVPKLEAWPLGRVFEFGQLLRERLGPEVPLRVPDIQSPFDIAALVWKKEALYLATLDAPEAVQGLVHKCLVLLKNFLAAFQRELGEVNLAHYPHAWAPPASGCWVSEDEAGNMSAAMFAKFCLPSLVELSETFGGLFIHCCAAADHQYPNFLQIPNLRGLNRTFQAPGPRPAIEAFSGRTVLIITGMGEAQIQHLLALARPDTRFLFHLPAQPWEQAKRTYERVRAWCARA